MTEQQKDFVHMYLKHRDKIVAHNLAYGNNSNIASVESSANRLLRIPEIADTIRSIQDNIRHEVEEEFKAKYREELMSIYEKRLLLKKIATGEMYVEQKYKGKNCTQCSQYISPTINQMLAAIREDNKLAGHYPHKQNSKWVIPALHTERVQEEDTSPLGRGWGGSIREEQEIQVDNPEQKTTTETTPLLPAPTEGRGFSGGDIGASASGGDKRQSGWLTREEQEIQVENLQQFTTTENQEISPLQGDLGVDSRNSNNAEKDNKEQQLEVLPPAGGGGFEEAGGGPLAQDNPEKDPSHRVIRADNKEQQITEVTIDNQPLTDEANPRDTPTVNSSGRIISQEQLRQLLYPQKPKLSYMKNNP